MSGQDVWPRAEVVLPLRSWEHIATWEPEFVCTASVRVLCPIRELPRDAVTTRDAQPATVSST